MEDDRINQIQSTPDLSVIIVSYNTRDMTRACLNALNAAGDGLNYDIIVVDNASRDGTIAMLQQEFPDVHTIANERNLGFGAANNQAFAQARGSYILLLNSDAILPPHSLRILLEEAVNIPCLGTLGCRLVNADGSLQRSCWRFPTLLNTALETFGLSRILRRTQNYQEWDYTTPRRVDFVIGACMLIPRAVLDAVGGFDERFFLYAEETDLCWRLNRAGYAVQYTPAITVMHIGSGSSTNVNAHRQNEFLRSKDLLIHKYYRRPGIGLYKGLMGIGALIRVCVFGGAYLPLKLLRPNSVPALTRKIQTYGHALCWSLGIRRDLFLSTLDTTG